MRMASLTPPARRRRRWSRPRSPVAASPASSAASSGSGLTRSASVIQPAFRRACMISVSASSRDRSKPSSAPGVWTFSPSLRSVQPTRSSVAQPARSSTVLMPALPSATSILVVTPGTSLHGVLDAERLPLGVELGLDAGEIVAGAGLQLGRGLLVEALDAGEFLDRDVGQFLDRVEAFGRQELADHLVDVERLHERPGCGRRIPSGAARTPPAR